jgi:rubredoxin
MSVRCPKCGGGNVVGYMGEWECMDCGYKFKLPTPPTYYGRPSNGKGKWVAGLILALIIGLLLGCLLGYSSSPIISRTVIVTQTIKVESPTTIEKTHTITKTTEVVKEKTVTVTAVVIPTPPTISEKHIVIHVGETRVIEDYEFSILSIKEVSYLSQGGFYFKPKEGMKLLVLSVKITYRGGDIGTCPPLGGVLLTDKGWAYDEAIPWNTEYISPENVTDEVRENAVEFNYLPTLSSLAPNTYCEGDILFQFPADEKPVKIVSKLFPYTTIEIVAPST